MGLPLIAFILAITGVVAAAQQPGKAARIGYLDNSTASGSAELWTTSENKCFSSIGSKERILPSSTGTRKALERLSELAVDQVAFKG